MPMPRSFGSAQVTSRPPMCTLPASASISPAIACSSVDLPQPDGPEQHQEFAFDDVEVELLEDGVGADAHAELLDRRRS